MAGDFLLDIGLTAAETGRLPDAVIRIGIRRLLRQRLRSFGGGTCEERRERTRQFLADARSSVVAAHPDRVNVQHYELSAAFFENVLGPRLKYSCCHWPHGVSSLVAAEESALELTCQRAGIRDGMDILELGCGWGSLSLWMAERFPGCRVVSVSNSAPQRAFIESRAAAQGLKNLRVLTKDVNDFSTEQTFDRVVSVEMFEHVRNHAELMHRISGWLRAGGRLFVHIFCHREHPYAFETEGADNWMGRYFFTGGIMPSDDLLLHYQRDLTLVDQWCWSGRHYQRTCRAWLERLDERRATVMPVLAATYGAREAKRWFNRWRIFFLACDELFGYRHGDEWWVSHYLFEK